MQGRAHALVVAHTPAAGTVRNDVDSCGDFARARAEATRRAARIDVAPAGMRARLRTQVPQLTAVANFGGAVGHRMACLVALRSCGPGG